MPWYEYHGLEKYAFFSTDYNTDYRLQTLPFETRLETLSTFIYSCSLTSLRWLQLKRPNTQSWWVWHLLAVSCCACATMTHFFKMCCDGKHFPTSAWALKYQQETLPCISVFTLEKADKTGLLTFWPWEPEKSFFALDKSLHPVWAVEASLGCCRIAWAFDTSEVSGSALGNPFLLGPPFCCL